VGESAIVFWEVVEEHLDDAEFLWTQWERSLLSPDYALTEVAERDEERLLANVDGLVAGGAAVRDRLVVPALASDDQARRNAAAFTLLASGDRAAADPVLALLRDGEPPQRASAERALGLGEAAWIDDALRSVLRDASPAGQAAALSALAFRRVSPGAALSGLRMGDDPALVAAAFRSASGWPDKAAASLVTDGLEAADRAVRDEAITAGLVLGMPAAWAACQKLLRRGDAESFPGPEPIPLLFAATLGEATDVEPLALASAPPELRRAAVWALGYSGRASAAELCLGLIDDADVGTLAGEAFAAITGLPLKAPFLAEEAVEERSEPVPFAAEDLNANLVPGPEEALPKLARRAVERWWGEQRSHFEKKGRYLLGAPWGRETVLSVLARGPMRRRRGVAIEVAVRTRGRVQVETGALTARQRADVAAAEGVQAGELERVFG
jgi:uncharacterized protein (TIGR02270 family)